MYVLLFVSVGVWAPYPSVYLQALGLDLATIGFLGGLGAVHGCQVSAASGLPALFGVCAVGSAVAALIVRRAVRPVAIA